MVRNDTKAVGKGKAQAVRSDPDQDEYTHDTYSNTGLAKNPMLNNSPVCCVWGTRCIISLPFNMRQSRFVGAFGHQREHYI